MIEIRIPKEINEYKERLFLSFTLRQTLSIVGILAINVPLWWLVAPIIGNDLAGWICIINAPIIGAIGFYRPNGMPLEKYIGFIFVTTFIYPPNRAYKTDNIFEEIALIIDREREAAERGGSRGFKLGKR
ncbi:MAG: PrgI family protein [Clostridiales bacterium]|jgi:hypothetical protein|nr:PrgI family protein [Clostridiales bacterium]